MRGDSIRARRSRQLTTTRLLAIPPYPAAWCTAVRILALATLVLILWLTTNPAHAGETNEADAQYLERGSRVAATNLLSGSGSRLTQGKIDQIADQVRAVMERELDLTIEHEVAVRLSGERRMTVQSSDGSLAGLESGAIGKFRNENGNFQVFLIDRATPAKAVRILAHELGHAYYEENYMKFKSREYREGFSEWVAYRVLENLGLKAEMRSMVRRTDLYGQGLRMMLKAEKKGGGKEVVRLAMM